jgi:hypothetical protein
LVWFYGELVRHLAEKRMFNDKLCSMIQDFKNIGENKIL